MLGNDAAVADGEATGVPFCLAVNPRVCQRVQTLNGRGKVPPCDLWRIKLSDMCGTK